MTSMAHRFKNDTAYATGDYGDVTHVHEKENTPKKPWRVIDMTSNRHVDTVHAATEKAAKTAMKKAGHDTRFHTVREETEVLLKNVLSEATAWVKDASKHTNSWTAAPGYTPCPTCHGVGSLRGKNDATDCHTCHGGGRVKKVEEADQSTHCAVCGDRHPTTDHPQSIHTARALGPENNVNESGGFSNGSIEIGSDANPGHSLLAAKATRLAYKTNKPEDHRSAMNAHLKARGSEFAPQPPKGSNFQPNVNRWNHHDKQAKMHKAELKESTSNDKAVLGKMKVTHVPTGKSRTADITNDHLHSIAHQDRFHELPKKFGGNVQHKYPKPQDYVDHLNRQAAAQKGNGGHEWHHELVTEGYPDVKTQERTRHLKTGYPPYDSYRKSTPEMWSDDDVEKANERRQEARKKAKTGWEKLKEADSKDIQRANKLEKCEACGRMHAVDMPCPDKKLLADNDKAKMKDSAAWGSIKKVDETRYYDHSVDKPILHPLIRKDSDDKHYMYMGSNENKTPEYRHHDGSKLHVKHGSFGTAIHPTDADDQEKYEKKVGTHHPGFWKGDVSEGKNKFAKFKSNTMTIKDTPEDMKRRSKAAVGMPPAKKVIRSKKDKPAKYKERFDESEMEHHAMYNAQHHEVLKKHGYSHVSSDPEHYSTYRHKDTSSVHLSPEGSWKHRGPNKSLTPNEGSSAKSLDQHLNKIASRKKSAGNAKARHNALTSLGLKRVRGAQGGTYYEEVNMNLLKAVLAEAGRDSTAMKVRLNKEKNPHLYCGDKKCLYRTGGGNCPKHGGAAKKPFVKDQGDNMKLSDFTK